MADNSTIAWCDTTWNPIIGCSRVSAGCGDGSGGGCYAERVVHRLAGNPNEKIRAANAGLTRSTPTGPRWTGTARLIPERLGQPLRWREPRRVFVNSLSDVFHESLSNEEIAAVFGVMAAAQRHTFQVLTKRPTRMREWFEWVADERQSTALGFTGSPWAVCYTAMMNVDPTTERRGVRLGRWPLPNVWLGVSVEDKATADARIPDLLATPAAVRFVSYEPALEVVSFMPWMMCCEPHGPQVPRKLTGVPGIDWLIVGGESGPGARPFDLAWARSRIEECKSARVPCFVKQLGSRPLETCAAPGAVPVEVRIRLKDRKGGDMSEWSPDLRVREMPR